MAGALPKSIEIVAVLRIGIVVIGREAVAIIFVTLGEMLDEVVPVLVMGPYYRGISTFTVESADWIVLSRVVTCKEVHFIDLREITSVTKVDGHYT